MGILLVLALAGACNRSGPAEAPATSGGNAAAPTAESAQKPPRSSGGGPLNAEVSPRPQALAAAEEEEVERGPTRQARCQIDDEPERPCALTPVFGDGSFDIEMPDRQLRLIVSGEEAAPFELIGTRRIPLAGLLRRDPQDRACWVAEEPDLGLDRVCAR